MLVVFSLLVFWLYEKSLGLLCFYAGSVLSKKIHPFNETVAFIYSEIEVEIRGVNW